MEAPHFRLGEGRKAVLGEGETKLTSCGVPVMVGCPPIRSLERLGLGKVIPGAICTDCVFKFGGLCLM